MQFTFFSWLFMRRFHPLSFFSLKVTEAAIHLHFTDSCMTDSKCKSWQHLLVNLLLLIRNETFMSGDLSSYFIAWVWHADITSWDADNTGWKVWGFFPWSHCSSVLPPTQMSTRLFKSGIQNNVQLPYSSEKHGLVDWTN